MHIFEIELEIRTFLQKLIVCTPLSAVGGGLKLQPNFKKGGAFRTFFWGGSCNLKKNKIGNI